MYTVKEIHNDFSSACNYNFDPSITAERLTAAGLPVQAQVLYFQQHLKTYKIITDSAVKDLAKKYSLIGGPLAKFTGYIPPKNIIELEQFKRTICVYPTWNYGDGDYYRQIYFFTKEEAIAYVTKHSISGWFGNLKGRLDCIERSGGYFFIVAPEKDVITEGVRSWNKDAAPDPIILWGPKREGNEVYAITTAWGDEAADVNIVNEKNN